MKNTISLHKWNDVEVKEDGYLYVKGQRVLTEQKIRLQLWVNIAIIVGAGSTLAIAIFQLISLLNN